MSVTLTALYEHSRYHNDLFEAIEGTTVSLICSDGQLSAPLLLLAAISPVVRDFGRQCCDCCEPNLILPDISVMEMQQFVSLLTSDSGPRNFSAWHTFREVLSILGSTTGSEPEPSLKKEASYSESDQSPPLDSFEEEDYEEEEEEEDEEPKKQKCFKKVGKFSEQVSQSYDSERRIFVCAMCGTERKRSDRLAHHLQWHEDHPGESYQARNNCPICGRYNATYFMLKMHMTRMHTDMPKTFVCGVGGCGKAFRFKGELKIHGLTHSKERNFVCSQCGERFRSKGQVELHAVRRHNPDTKPSIPCEECGKLFRIQADLRNHLSRTHRARLQRIHRCLDCDLTFRSEKALLAHNELHNPERPLQCSRCTLRYKNKDALVAHEKTHDNAQFACEFCSFAFKRKDNLKRHIRSKHKSMFQSQNQNLMTNFIMPAQ